MAENNSLSFLADQYTINKTPEKWRESEEEILTAKRKKRQSRERRRKNTAVLPGSDTRFLLPFKISIR